MANDTQLEVRVQLNGGPLLGDLLLPAGAPGVVVIVSGQGRGRHGAAECAVAHGLAARGLGTVRVDLLTPDEQREPPHAGLHGVDLPLLTERLLAVADWLCARPELQRTGLGLCGLAGGSAACLIVGARLGSRLRAIACLGGQPDMAGDAVLATVRAHTLLMAGSLDLPGLAQGDRAYQHLRGERSLAVVPGAGPLLDEPGALAHAAEMAASWFEAHLAPLEEMA